MDASITLTIDQLLKVIAAMVAIWGGYKVLLELVDRINAKHDQVQKWDEYDKQIKQIKEEQCLLSFCMLATLDGLKQLGADGKVTEARDKLDKHLNKIAHGVDIE
jgi:hypothetical protein